MNVWLSWMTWWHVINPVPFLPAVQTLGHLPELLWVKLVVETNCGLMLSLLCFWCACVCACCVASVGLFILISLDSSHVCNWWG